MGTDKGRDAILAQLKDYIRQRASLYLADGQKLAITVTDVDLAGDFEPTRGTNWEDVRIIREIYPPRVNLSFQVTDADGKVVKEGTRRLVDLAFEMNVPINNTDPLDMRRRCWMIGSGRISRPSTEESRGELIFRGRAFASGAAALFSFNERALSDRMRLPDVGRGFGDELMWNSGKLENGMVCPGSS